MDIILISDRMPPKHLEIWLYSGSKQKPDEMVGHWDGLEFKRSVLGADTSQSNVWGWRMITDSDLVSNVSK